MAQKKEIKVLSFEPSPCMREEKTWRINRRVAGEDHRGDTLTISLSLVANCCETYLDGAWWDNDIIWLQTRGKRVGSYVNASGDTIEEEILCDCECCFELTFELTGVDRLPKGYRHNGRTIQRSPHHYKLVKPKFKVIDGDTLNRKDHYGLKQGRHVVYHQDGKLKSDLIYRDDRPVSGLDTRFYFDNGAMWLEYWVAENGQVRQLEYDECANLIRDCLLEDKLDSCPER